SVASLRAPDEYMRTEVSVPLDRMPGESRGYWKYYVPGKRFKEAKVNGKVNNANAVVMLDSGSEVSIIDTTFVREVGCYVDTSQSQECLGIGEKLYVATGRTKIKLTLAGHLAYYYDVWVGDDLPPDYQAILGMDFMVLAGIRYDLGDGSMCLPNEIRIQLHGRRQIFSDRARTVTIGQCISLAAGETAELPQHMCGVAGSAKICYGSRKQWVPTLAAGLEATRYLQITNVGDTPICLQHHDQVGMWLVGDHVPRKSGFVSVGSWRYTEWQNLVHSATTDRRPDPTPESPEPAVPRPVYPMPKAIMSRQEEASKTRWIVAHVSML
ncbi:hypothetical protein PHYSODRAFT_472299, partial [Phytophthora sojae]